MYAYRCASVYSACCADAVVSPELEHKLQSCPEGERRAGRERREPELVMREREKRLAKSDRKREREREREIGRAHV